MDRNANVINASGLSQPRIIDRKCLVVLSQGTQIWHREKTTKCIHIGIITASVAAVIAAHIGINIIMIIHSILFLFLFYLIFVRFNGQKSFDSIFIIIVIVTEKRYLDQHVNLRWRQTRTMLSTSFSSFLSLSFNVGNRIGRSSRPSHTKLSHWFSIECDAQLYKTISRARKPAGHRRPNSGPHISDSQ